MYTEFLTDDEIADLTHALKPPHCFIFQLGLDTGLRISDIITLEKKRLWVREPTIKEKKTGKTKRIYIKKDLRKKLIKYSEKHKKYVFQSRSKSGHISRQAVFKAFKKAAAQCGIEKKIGTHSMRKSYARRLYSKKPLKYVQCKLNHENVAETLLYVAERK